MKKLILLGVAHLVTIAAHSQDVKSVISIRPGFSFPTGDYRALAAAQYNAQIDWQHYFSPKAALGFGFLQGGNKFEADEAAGNLLNNTPGATIATVAANNYKYTAVYGMATYNFTSSHKLAVEFTTRLGVCFSTYPAISAYAADALFDYVDASETSDAGTSFYYTGALVLRYPLSERFDISLSNEYVRFTGKYNTKGTDYLTMQSYTSSFKQDYSLIFTSVGLNWKFNK
ncbi:MAG: hypothetical protein K1X81_04735 [Bacteroidia bacterium]|nr:hypothetical protein [Bacteroidia bacterium]